MVGRGRVPLGGYASVATFRGNLHDAQIQLRRAANGLPLDLDDLTFQAFSIRQLKAHSLESKSGQQIFYCKQSLLTIGLATALPCPVRPAGAGGAALRRRRRKPPKRKVRCCIYRSIRRSSSC